MDLIHVANLSADDRLQWVDEDEQDGAPDDMAGMGGMGGGMPGMEGMGGMGGMGGDGGFGGIGEDTCHRLCRTYH